MCCPQAGDIAGTRLHSSRGNGLGSGTTTGGIATGEAPLRLVVG